eukprot:2236553-Rhodomonas_salina.2
MSTLRNALKRQKVAWQQHTGSISTAPLWYLRVRCEGLSEREGAGSAQSVHGCCVRKRGSEEAKEGEAHQDGGWTARRSESK